MVAVVLVGWAWRLAGVTSQSLWRDEVDSLRFATRAWPEMLAAFSRPGENGPLFYLLLRPWLTLAGHSEFALRFPGVWMGVLTLPLIFVWGKSLFGPKIGVWTGLLAAFLLALAPYHIWYSQEARMYALVVVLVMLSMWCFREAVTRGGWPRWGAWYLFTSMGFYIHVLTALALGVQLVWLGLTPDWRRRWRPAAIALGLLILPYLPLIGWQWKLLTNGHFRTGLPFVPLGKMLGGLFTVQVEGILPAAFWFLALAGLLLIAALLLPASRRSLRDQSVTLLTSWILLPPLLLFLISLITPLYLDRYLIWTLPALVLMIAVGEVNVARRSPPLALLLLTILIAFQLHQDWRQMHLPVKPDMRAAAEYVAPRRGPQELTLFLMPYIHDTYQYYDPGPYAWAEAPYANRQPDASQIPQHLMKLTSGYSGLWLVESEAAFYDRSGLIHAWLDKNADLVNEAHFALVDVYHYHLP